MNYIRGSHGPEVVKIQAELQKLGWYRGPLDGDFGGGTESAVKSFQSSKGLSVDGIVGPDTWRVLFAGEEIASPSIALESIEKRCLALTGSFETNAGIPDCFAGLSGDFDGQGLSFGVLQWNLGQGSLQPLLAEMDREYPSVMQQVFHENYPVLKAVLESTLSEQLEWARSIQDPVRSTVREPWRGLFKTLGRIDEFQNIEVQHSQELHRQALQLCLDYGLQSERAAALMFDIKVQNGSISRIVKEQILQDFKSLSGADDPANAEVARMRIIANRRAEAANPRWVEDVRARKLTIAEGIGVVHGNHYDLAAQYGIRMQPAS